MAQPLEAMRDLFDEESSVSLNYSENPAAKKLLGAIVSILTEEFIQTGEAKFRHFSLRNKL
jgi:hypothetical protein